MTPKTLRKIILEEIKKALTEADPKDPTSEEPSIAYVPKPKPAPTPEEKKRQSAETQLAMTKGYRALTPEQKKKAVDLVVNGKLSPEEAVQSVARGSNFAGAMKDYEKKQATLPKKK